MFESFSALFSCNTMYLVQSILGEMLLDLILCVKKIPILVVEQAMRGIKKLAGKSETQKKATLLCS